MWRTLDDAAAAMKRDGWTRYTAYWWHKTVSNRKVWVEIEWRPDLLWPVEVEEGE